MAATGTRTPLGMPMDIYRTKDGTYHVEADLPGAEPGPALARGQQEATARAGAAAARTVARSKP